MPDHVQLVEDTLSCAACQEEQLEGQSESAPAPEDGGDECCFICFSSEGGPLFKLCACHTKAHAACAQKLLKVASQSTKQSLMGASRERIGSVP